MPGLKEVGVSKPREALTVSKMNWSISLVPMPALASQVKPLSANPRRPVTSE